MLHYSLIVDDKKKNLSKNNTGNFNFIESGKKFKNFVNSINILIGQKLVFFCYFVFAFSTLSAFLEVFSIGSIALFLGVIFPRSPKFLLSLCNPP